MEKIDATSDNRKREHQVSLKNLIRPPTLRRRLVFSYLLRFYNTRALKYQTDCAFRCVNHHYGHSQHQS